MDVTQLYKDINSYTTFFANRLYIGIMEFGELIDEHYCEPIITAELWEQVQQVQREVARATTENSPRRIGSNFILSGLVFCQHCGSPLNGHIIAKAGKFGVYRSEARCHIRIIDVILATGRFR